MQLSTMNGDHLSIQCEVDGCIVLHEPPPLCTVWSSTSAAHHQSNDALVCQHCYQASQDRWTVVGEEVAMLTKGSQEMVLCRQ